MATQAPVSLQEKRQLLELVRIKFGFETTIPRVIAIDKIVEKALAESSEQNPLIVADIVERLAGRKLPLRFGEVEKALERLGQGGRVKKTRKDNQPAYFLGTEAASDIDREIREASARIERVATRLYRGVPADWVKLRRFLLQFLSDVFARLGREWVEVAVGRARIEDMIVQGAVQNLFETAAKNASIEKKTRKLLFDRTLQFFRQPDADYNLLKFILGQSYFITHLLALDEPYDHLSSELFSEGELYLDTNVVIVALLPGANRFRALQEVVNICKRLRIHLMVLEPTYRETQRVVAYEQTEVAPVYDDVPPELVEKTKGHFYQTYVSLKKEDPSFTAADVFKPFADLRKTLAERYEIEVLDDPAFDKLQQHPALEKMKTVLAEQSLVIRKRKKGPDALAHDAVVCLFVESQRMEHGKARVLTLDRSLPPASTELFSGEYSLAISLDGFLQSISPFISTDRELDFATIFGQLIEAQLLPQDQIYDIRDYLIFHDMGMSCQTMSTEEVDEALHMLKTKVLRGDHYTRDDFHKASYEFRKLFTQRYLQKEDLVAQKQREIETLKRSHQQEKEKRSSESTQKIREAEEKFTKQLDESRADVEKLRAELKTLQGQIEKDRVKRLRLLRWAKWAAIILWAVGGLYGATWLALTYGEGPNWFQKLKDVWAVYVSLVTLVMATGELLIRWLVPEHDVLAKLLPSIFGKKS